MDASIYPMPPFILIIDDDEHDALFLTRAIRLAGIKNPIIHIEDAGVAMDQLQEEGRLPFVIFLDLKMFGVDGFQFLDWKRGQPHLAGIPAVVTSGSPLEVDIVRSKSLGAVDYFTKPLTSQEADQILTPFEPSLIRGSPSTDDDDLDPINPG